MIDMPILREPVTTARHFQVSAVVAAIYSVTFETRHLLPRSDVWFTKPKKRSHYAQWNFFDNFIVAFRNLDGSLTYHFGIKSFEKAKAFIAHNCPLSPLVFDDEPFVYFDEIPF